MASLPASPVAERLTGEVVYLYAYDVAYEMARQPIESLLGEKLVPFRIDMNRRGPRHQLFYQPQLLRLPARERTGPRGRVRVETAIKVLTIGAISISVRIPFSVERLEDLQAFHDPEFSDGNLNEEIRRLAESIRDELAPHIRRPIDQLMDEEAYTVFCIHGPLEGMPEAKTEAWLERNRRDVAALLTQEDGATLSDQEVAESTHRHLSYFRDDLIVVDWDAALILDQPADTTDALHILELANLQLAELEAYDRHLDTTLVRSYRDLGSQPLRRRSAMLRELRELRIDMARVNDELSNLSKFFGDWHLARVHEAAAARFHLADWQRSVQDKLKTLDELHQILKSDQGNRWMMILEVTVVLLFIIDVAMLFRGGR
jgi:hypothetical protein